MNKKIKFRAWDTKNKRFYDEIPQIEEWIDSDCWDDAEQLMEDPYIYPSNVTPTFNGRFIWQQYINVDDCNGREIYEGDILKYANSDLLSVVRFADLSDDCYPGWRMNDSWNQGGRITIVGNIFENSELVEK